MCVFSDVTDVCRKSPLRVKIQVLHVCSIEYHWPNICIVRVEAGQSNVMLGKLGWANANICKFLNFQLGLPAWPLAIIIIDPSPRRLWSTCKVETATLPVENQWNMVRWIEIPLQEIKWKRKINPKNWVWITPSYLVFWDLIKLILRVLFNFPSFVLDRSHDPFIQRGKINPDNQ